MKKTNVDLIVGGSILLALFILIGGVLWLKEASVSARMVTYTALFDNVGTLQVGDPIMVNGVKKGTVADIFLRGTDVAVSITVDKGVRITDSTRVTVQNIGLMGERGIGVKLTTVGKKINPNSSKDTTFISGKFDSGIAEAMGMLGTVLAEVETLAQNVTGILDNTIADTSFVTFFNTMVNRLDTISDVAQDVLVRNEPLLNRSVDNISVLSSDLKVFFEENRPRLNAILANSETISGEALDVVAHVDTLVGSLQYISGKIEKGEGVVGQLIHDEEFYPDLKKTLASIDTLVTEIQDDALRLRVRLGFRKRKD